MASRPSATCPSSPSLRRSSGFSERGHPVSELCWTSMTELARMIAGKKVSPVEVVQAHLDRIAAIDGKVKAYITVMGESALAAARAAEAAVQSGATLGPLHGVPVGLKDLYCTKGVRTTGGSKLLGDWIPGEDATVTARLAGARAICLGKLNMHEFAYGPEGLNPHYGTPWNPWDVATHRICGGSSSGSGAAVAAGLCPGALGSDTGGSIRIPSSLCGLSGIKPTYGRVSRAGVLPLAWSMDHVGPMCRSVADCALMLAPLAGYDPRDPTTSVLPVPDYAAPSPDRSRDFASVSSAPSSSRARARRSVLPSRRPPSSSRVRAPPSSPWISRRSISVLPSRTPCSLPRPTPITKSGSRRARRSTAPMFASGSGSEPSSPEPST